MGGEDDLLARYEQKLQQNKQDPSNAGLRVGFRFVPGSGPYITGGVEAAVAEQALQYLNLAKPSAVMVLETSRTWLE